jgi:hypothetical protein
MIKNPFISNYRLSAIIFIAVALLVALFFLSFYQSTVIGHSTSSLVPDSPSPTVDPQYVKTIPAVPGNHALQQFAVKNRLEADHSTYENYIIEYPASWNLRRVQQIYGTDLLLTRDDYELNLSQSGSDVGNCKFEGELTNGVNATDHISQDYTQIRAENHLYRRVINPDKKPGKIFMYFCEHINGSYTFPQIATITYTSPKDYDPSVIEEMDNMIRSIQIVKR